MAYTTINKSTAHFDAKLWNGDSNPITISGYEFQPDFVWIKRRNSNPNHGLYDAVRGATKFLESSATSPEQTLAAGLTAFTSDGYTLGGAGQVSTGGGTYVGWNWKANGAGSANTDGSINSTVSVNTTAGFSIVKYTGTGSAGTVGHGLGVAPKMIIVKCLDTAKAWTVYHSALGSSAAIFLEQNSAATTSNTTYFNGTDPTTSVFSIGSSTNVTNSGDEFIAYCFAEKTGYSKFGKYIANASSDGTFLYCGFKPKFLMVKRTNQAAPWSMIDASRNTYNPANLELQADATSAEANQGDGCDFLSNGVKLRDSADMNSGSGDSFIYMAFGQSLVGTNDIPCTAR